MNKYHLPLLRISAFVAIALSNALPTKAAPPTPAPSARQGAYQSYPAQASVAAKSSFGAVPATAPQVAKAIDAKDLADASRHIGAAGAFHGTVSSVYSPRNHGIVILDFDTNYRTALTAVVKPDAYTKFPPIDSLAGKQVIVMGKFTDYQGRPQIVLTNPAQIKIVK